MYLPQRYIYATDSSVKGVILLRPIDTIVSVIRLCDNKDTIRSLLRKIYANLDSKELVCMLLQIYSDKDGVYFQGGFIDRKIEQMLGKRNSKDRYQEYYENNTDVNK